MKRSTDRILTTHTGSLPRAPKVVELLLAERQNPGARKAELNASVGDAIAHVVQKQIESGIDVINDGEQGRTDYTVHVIDRLAGFDGKSAPALGTGDPEFPELAQLLSQFASPFQYRPSCTGEVTWKDWGAAQADIDLSKEAMRGANATELFMTAPSPGQIARYLKNKHYETEEAYVYALADTMKREYEAIVDAGFILQLDCPDLAMLRHTVYLDKSLSDFRKIIAVNVAALNRAVTGIPADRMRMHLCWARRWHRITPTCHSWTSLTSCFRQSRWRCLSLPPTRGTSTNGRFGAR
jgi:5-methyltetrahydropteroyltriglutamate--homocysteine methyltransferase